MAYYGKSAAIGLIDPHTLVRSLSPELMLVDPELAERARELLREPCETNGKVWHMSALGTHEITAGIGLGLEPPLSPPVVRGPSASVPMPSQRPNDNISDLPEPSPGHSAPGDRPGGSRADGRACSPGRDSPAARASAGPRAARAGPAGRAARGRAASARDPAAEPEPELPVMAPAEEPVIDYFAQPEPAGGGAAGDRPGRGRRRSSLQRCQRSRRSRSSHRLRRSRAGGRAPDDGTAGARGRDRACRVLRSSARRGRSGARGSGRGRTGADRGAGADRSPGARASAS